MIINFKFHFLNYQNYFIHLDLGLIPTQFIIIMDEIEFFC